MSSVKRGLCLVLGLLGWAGGVAGGEEPRVMVLGLERGAESIQKLLVEHRKRKDHSIVMSASGRFTLFPKADGTYLISEQTGKSLRNFEIVETSTGGFAVQQIELLPAGSIIGATRLSGPRLKQYMERMNHGARPKK